MPKEQEEALKQVAEKYARQGKLKKKKGQTMKEAENAFTYGILRKRGWKPQREK